MMDEARPPKPGERVQAGESQLAKDAVLIDRLRRGDETAMREVFEAFFPRLVDFAVQVNPSRKDLAEEVAMEVLVQLWERRGALETTMALKVQLYRDLLARLSRGPGRDHGTGK